MKRNLWLIALFLALSLVISSYAASTWPYQNRKLCKYLSSDSIHIFLLYD